MSVSLRSVVKVLLALVLLAGLLGAVACSGSNGGDSTSESSGESAADEGDTSGESDSDSNDSSAEGLTPEQEDDALDIARAYLVGLTDLAGDDFEFNIEAAAQADDGIWWARVTATPSDMSMETEQIYVRSNEAGDFWFGHDMGTGIDPMTDENFPEEVREALAP